MTVAVLYVITAVIFLALDALMLGAVMRPLFERHIGEMLLADIRVVPAVLFYLGYVAGVVYLVGLPALRSGAPVLVPAMVIGAMAYGTYEFTSYAIMKGWHPAMVATDVIWGTLLTGFSAWAGVTLTRILTA